MNRKEIRKRICQLTGTMKSDSDLGFVEVANACIDAGVRRMVQELPSALSPQQLRVFTPAEIQASGGITLTTTADPWVLEFSNASSHPCPTDGTESGIYELWVTLSDNSIARYRVRECWTTSAPTKYYIAIDQQWASGSAPSGGWTDWRLVVPRLYLPEGVQKIRSCKTWGPDGAPVEIRNYTFDEVTWRSWPVRMTSTNSLLGLTVARSRHVKLRDPNKAPVAAVVEGVWGDEPYGVFDYCYTYAYGKRPAQARSEQGNEVPLWESAPSPIVESVTVPSSFWKVNLTLPRIDWQLNFGASGTIRVGRSGYYLRIYRKRRTIGGGNNTDIEVGEIFQFLGECDGNDGLFVDDGSNIPDYQLRLPEIHGYYAWELWPRPTQAHEWEVWAEMAVESLRNDYDAPRVEPQHIDALCHFCAAEYAKATQQLEVAATLEEYAIKQVKNYMKNIQASGAAIPKAAFILRNEGNLGLRIDQMLAGTTWTGAV